MPMSSPAAHHHDFPVTTESMVLQSVNVQIAFNNLFCETTMRQAYKNLGEKPVEAVYTFPLASNAVLLGLKVTIGDRELQGKVVERTKAEEQYEDAIIDGNTAIMLEQHEQGLYTMNVGNILAGEEISITIVYTELYTWQGDTLRFFLPTTIAPRYGSPEQAGLQPHQIPEYDLLTENRFQLKMTLKGSLACAKLECPSHKIAVSESENETVITLAASEAFMDRDFILNIRVPQGEKDAVLIDRDIDGGYVALASFAPRLSLPEEIPPMSVKILVDCSGSMAGDSIAQARKAIGEILNHLRPEDFFNLIAFGNSVDPYFKKQIPATKSNLTKVRNLLTKLDADMGGTGMEKALQATVDIPGPELPQDILLITDGEVWQSDEIIRMIKTSKHRVFSVGVGSAVSEGFVREIALASGGACELVAPNEKMAEKIVRHFKRIFLPRAERVAVRWPVKPAKTITKDVGSVYDGDTLNVFARFKDLPQGEVTLDMTLADGRTLSQTAKLSGLNNLMPGNDAPGPLARMAISQSLNGENERTAAKLAERYQLISPYTNYFVMEERAEDVKGKELPELLKVPQMLAAGWGGMGGINEHTPDRCYELGPSAPAPTVGMACKEFISPAEVFIEHFNSFVRFGRLGNDIKELCRVTAQLLPKRLLQHLKTIATEYDPEAQEDDIVLAFLIALRKSAIGKLFSRDSGRLLLKAKKARHLDEGLIKIIADTLSDILKMRGGWN